MLGIFFPLFCKIQYTWYISMFLIPLYTQMAYFRRSNLVDGAYKRERNKILKAVTIFLLGASLSILLANADLIINPQISNSIAYIKQFFVTSDGTNNGTLGVILQGSWVFSTKYCNLSGTNCKTMEGIDDQITSLSGVYLTWGQVDTKINTFSGNLMTYLSGTYYDKTGVAIQLAWLSSLYLTWGQVDIKINTFSGNLMTYLSGTYYDKTSVATQLAWLSSLYLTWGQVDAKINTLSGTLNNLARANLTCSQNQLPQFSGGVWTCGTISSVVETDPIWIAASGNYYDKTGINNKWYITASQVTANETDPIWTAASGNYYTTGQINAKNYITGGQVKANETDPIWIAASGMYVKNSYLTVNYSTTTAINNTLNATPLFNPAGSNCTDGQTMIYDENNDYWYCGSISNNTEPLWTAASGNYYTKTTIDAKWYITGGQVKANETDPQWNSQSGNYVKTGYLAVNYYTTGVILSFFNSTPLYNPDLYNCNGWDTMFYDGQGSWYCGAVSNSSEPLWTAASGAYLKTTNVSSALASNLDGNGCDDWQIVAYESANGWVCISVNAYNWDTAAAFVAKATASNTLVIDNANHRVGIWTNAPQGKLEVAGGSLYVNAASGWTNVPVIELKTSTIGTIWNIGWSDSGFVDFMIWAGDLWAWNYFNINKSTWNVGIWVTWASQKLEVNGIGKFITSIRTPQICDVNGSNCVNLSDIAGLMMSATPGQMPVSTATTTYDLYKASTCTNINKWALRFNNQYTRFEWCNGTQWVYFTQTPVPPLVPQAWVCGQLDQWGAPTCEVWTVAVSPAYSCNTITDYATWYCTWVYGWATSPQCVADQQQCQPSP